MPKITFAVYDEKLLEMIEKGIMPHLPAGEIKFHQGLPGRWSPTSLLLVAVSGIVDKSDMDTIMCANDRGQRCGVIALSPSFQKWEALAFCHRYMPFKCFVAVEVETAYARRMIPRLDILSDIGDLAIPGKQIAEYLWKAVVQAEQLGPIPRPYAVH